MEWIKAKDRAIDVKESYTLVGKEKVSEMRTRSVRLDEANGKLVAKSCGFENVQVYYEDKFYPAGEPRFQYILSETGSDCGYPIPRMVAEFLESPLRNGFILESDFRILDKKQAEAAKARFEAAKKKGDDLSTSDFMEYGSPMAFFSRTKEKDAIYILTNKTEMGTKASLYRLIGKKLEEVAEASFPACGS